MKQLMLHLYGILPVIFVIENNGYGLSTPSSEQFNCKQFSDKGIGYGIDAYTIDGNNIIDVYKKVLDIKKNMLIDPKPVILECMTFRMRGHEEASGTKYVPKILMNKWSKRDPLNNYEEFLNKRDILSSKSIKELKIKINNDINDAWKISDSQPSIKSTTQDELKDVYRFNNYKEIAPSKNQISQRLVDAVSDALKLSMLKHDNLVLMGQDIAEYGGVFKITEGFVEKFGKERVRNTPICESAILSAGLGLSINGFKSVIEMQFADFVSSGFNAVVNNLAKTHYRWGENVDVVVRMPTGAGVGAGPFHSQSNEAWFTHTPGLKVVYPAFPHDAKGLLISSINDPNPVMFFEHKALYRSYTSNVPDNYYTIEIGKGNLVRNGNDISIVTYGMGVHWAIDFLNENKHVSADLIDLRTLIPLDVDIIMQSVKKTGKVIILQEDTITGGIGSDISAIISEKCFEYLDGPIIRSASLDTPVPFSLDLEKNFLANSRFKDQVFDLLSY